MEEKIPPEKKPVKMKYYKVLAITSIILATHFIIEADTINELQDVIYQQDIAKMFEVANESTENEKAVVDVFCTEIDLNGYSYEQLKSWLALAKSETVSKMLSHALKQKEIDILNELRSLTAEDIMAYCNDFPERKEVVSTFVDNILLPNINELSLLELVYLDDYLPEDFHQKISKEIDSRTEEVQEMLNKKHSDYTAYENALTQRLKYIVDYTLWTYFVEGNKELNKAYSQIGIVPDSPYLAAEQYQNLVSACFPTEQIRQALQKEVDKFCIEINQARQDYYVTSGKKTYSKLSYKVPAFILDSYVSIAPLQEISEARERYLQNREDISKGTSVLGWLLGPAVGLISQGIGDWMAIDGLVTSEFDARKKYMVSVQEQMLSNFVNYSNKVISGIEKSL